MGTVIVTESLLQLVSYPRSGTFCYFSRNPNFFALKGRRPHPQTHHMAPSKPLPREPWAPLTLVFLAAQVATCAL